MAPLVLRQINGRNYIHNDELQPLLWQLDTVKEIKKKRLVWIGHTWKKHNFLIKKWIEEDTVGRIPLGKSRPRQENWVKWNAKLVKSNRP